jgi:hypothetical protein
MGSFLAACLMIAVAGYCGARLVVSGVWGIPTHRLADFSHLLMGWAMAGMYIPVLMSPMPPQMWQLVFVVLTVAFFAAFIRARQLGERSEESVYRNHGITVFAMVFMLVEMPSGHSGGGDEPYVAASDVAPCRGDHGNHAGRVCDVTPGMGDVRHRDRTGDVPVVAGLEQRR